MSNMCDSLSRWEQQNLALAAVAQCAALVHSYAARGDGPQVETCAAINPLLALDPPKISQIYPELGDLSLGLRTLQDIFSSDKMREHAEVVRYTLGMLLLRNRLVAGRSMQEEIRQRLRHVDLLQPLDAEALDDPDHPRHQEQDRQFRQLASLYQDTISTLSYRIQVQGKIDFLQDENIANKIRSLLFAGIRSAVLWYQLGGRRWRLVIYRKRIHETAHNLRRTAITTV